MLVVVLICVSRYGYGIWVVVVPDRSFRANGWDPRKIVRRRGRTCKPFQSGTVPGIVGRRYLLVPREVDIQEEYKE